MVTHCSLSVLVFLAGSLCTITPEVQAAKKRSASEQSSGALIEVRDASELKNIITPGKPYVLNFFMMGTCGHCTVAHPKVVKLAQDNPDITFISVDRNSTKGIESVAGAYDINGYPSFVFFDGQGNQLTYEGQTKMAGFAGEEPFNARLNAIRKGVAQPANGAAAKVKPQPAPAPKMVAKPQPMPQAQPTQPAARPQRPHARPKQAGAACPQPAACPAPAPRQQRAVRAAASNMIDLGSEQQLNEIYKEHEYVALIFSTPWCSMCPGMKPKYAQMAQEFPGVFFVNVNGDNFKSLVNKLNVTGYPRAVLMRNGKQVSYIGGGGLDVSVLRSKFKSFVSR